MSYSTRTRLLASAIGFLAITQFAACGDSSVAEGSPSSADGVHCEGPKCYVHTDGGVSQCVKHTNGVCVPVPGTCVEHSGEPCEEEPPSGGDGHCTDLIGAICSIEHVGPLVCDGIGGLLCLDLGNLPIDLCLGEGAQCLDILAQIVNLLANDQDGHLHQLLAILFSGQDVNVILSGVLELVLDDQDGTVVELLDIILSCGLVDALAGDLVETLHGLVFVLLHDVGGVVHDLLSGLACGQLCIGDLTGLLEGLLGSGDDDLIAVVLGLIDGLVGNGALDLGALDLGDLLEGVLGGLLVGGGGDSCEGLSVLGLCVDLNVGLGNDSGETCDGLYLLGICVGL